MTSSNLRNISPCKQVKVSDTVDVKGMVVDASYTGPRLEEDCIITKEFVSNMVQHFKQSQTIHSRCAPQYYTRLMTFSLVMFYFD